jgi:hypothetical protein
MSPTSPASLIPEGPALRLLDTLSLLTLWTLPGAAVVSLLAPLWVAPGNLAHFNAVLLAAAGLMLLVFMVSGTLRTAHDGALLGKSGHSLWAPVTLVFGTALLLPVHAGLSLLQLWH